MKDFLRNSYDFKKFIVCRYNCPCLGNIKFKCHKHHKIIQSLVDRSSDSKKQGVHRMKKKQQDIEIPFLLALIPLVTMIAIMAVTIILF